MPAASCSLDKEWLSIFSQQLVSGNGRLSIVCTLHNLIFYRQACFSIFLFFFVPVGLLDRCCSLNILHAVRITVNNGENCIIVIYTCRLRQMKEICRLPFIYTIGGIFFFVMDGRLYARVNGNRYHQNCVCLCIVEAATADVFMSFIWFLCTYTSRNESISFYFSFTSKTVNITSLSMLTLKLAMLNGSCVWKLPVIIS